MRESRPDRAGGTPVVVIVTPAGANEKMRKPIGRPMPVAEAFNLMDPRFNSPRPSVLKVQELLAATLYSNVPLAPFSLSTVEAPPC